MEKKHIEVLKENFLKNQKLSDTSFSIEDIKSNSEFIEFFNELIDIKQDYEKEVTKKNTQINELRKLMGDGLRKFEQKVFEFSFLRRVSSLLANSTDLKRLYTDILNVILDEAEAEHCSIFLYNEENKLLERVAAKGISFVSDTQQEEPQTFEPGEGIAGKVFSSQKPEYISDTSANEDFIFTKTAPLSLISIPLLLEEECIGVINISHSEQHAFPDDSVHILSIIAHQVAIAIKIAKLHNELQGSREKVIKTNLNLEKEIDKRTHELLQAKEFNSSIIESLNSGIIVFDNNLKPIKTSQKGLEILEQESFEKLLHAFETSNIFIPFYELLKKEIENPSEKSHRGSFKLSLGKNKEIVIGFTLTELNINEQIDGYVLNFRDITEIIKLREKEERNQKLSFILSLIRKIAHEVRNPLNSIQGFAQLFSFSDNLTKENRQKYTTIIMSEIEKVDSIITNLVNLVHKPEISEITNVNVNNIIQNLIFLFSIEIHEKNVAVEENLNATNVLSSEKKLIEKALFNIFLNAVNYTEMNGKISITTENYDQDIIVIFEDNGEGISKKSLQNIFEPFTGAKGLGLGLPVTKIILDTINSEIFVDSKEGQYTKVKIIFRNVTK